MLGPTDDPDYLEIPFDEPLSEDEAARVLGFWDASDPRYITWEWAMSDPNLPPPDPSPRSIWGERPFRPSAWDIHRPNGGVLDCGDGYWETDDPVTPADIRGVCRRSGVPREHEDVVVADAAAAWKAGNAARKTLYIVAKAGVIDIVIEDDGQVGFILCRREGLVRG
jgi:hypothetical protein